MRIVGIRIHCVQLVVLADAAFLAEILRRTEAAPVRADIAFGADEGRILPERPHDLLEQLRGGERAQQHHVDAAVARREHHVAVGVGDDGDDRRLGQHRIVHPSQLPDEGLAADGMCVPVEQDDVRFHLRLAVEARPGFVGIAEHIDRLEAEGAQDAAEDAHHRQHPFDRKNPDPLQVFRPADFYLRFLGRS